MEYQEYMQGASNNERGRRERIFFVPSSWRVGRVHQ